MEAKLVEMLVLLFFAALELKQNYSKSFASIRQYFISF